MRLLLITPFYSPGVGGSTRLLQDVVDFAVKNGHYVIVLTFGSLSDHKIKEFDSAQSYQIVRIEPSRGTGTSSLIMAAQAAKLIVVNRINTVFCGVAYASAIIAYFVTRFFRVPFAVYSHGEDASCVEGSNIKSKLLKRSLNAASVIMTNSHFTLEVIKKLGVNEKKLYWIPPGINPAPYLQVNDGKVEALRSKLGLLNDPILLTVARLNPRKGHDTVIKALPGIVAVIPNVKYLIVGGGDQTELRELSKKVDVQESVVYIDYVSESDLPLLYHLCDVYVMVSRIDPETNEVEGFGMVYLEAGASGKPSIAGSAGGCADAVEDQVTGIIVDPLSVPDLTNAALYLLSNPTVAQEMGRRGKERVCTTFTKELLLPRFLELLTSVANQPN